MHDSNADLSMSLNRGISGVSHGTSTTYNSTHNNNNKTNNNTNSNFILDDKGKTRILVSDKSTGVTKHVKIKKFHVKNPYHAPSVGELICQITPSAPLVSNQGIVGGTHSSTTGGSGSSGKGMNECLLSLRVAKFEFSGTASTTSLDTKFFSSTSSLHLSHATNNANSSMSLNQNNSGTTPTNHIKQIKKQINPKMKNKLRYVCILRSTNHLLMKKKKNDAVFIKKRKRRLRRKDKDGNKDGDKAGGGVGIPGNGELDDSEDSDDDSDEDEYDHDTAYNDSDDSDEDDDEDNDDESNDGYDTLYNPEDNDDDHNTHKSHRSNITSVSKKSSSSKKSRRSNKSGKILSSEYVGEEASSFPLLICLALQSDGSNPDIRKVVELEHLVGIESVASKGIVQLVFQTGEVVEIDCDLGMEDGNGPGGIGGGGPGTIVTAMDKHAGLKKEQFLWSLLQIHAILCTSVVERILSKAGAAARGNENENEGTSDSAGGKTGKPKTPTGAYSTSTTLVTRPTIASLPPLTMRNVDRAELQYISTVNGFLSDSPVLQALLERQRMFSTKEKQLLQEEDGAGGTRSNVPVGTTGLDEEERKESTLDDMDDIAYDMIMGNFTRLTLFLNEKEKQDAEEVMNALSWQQEEKGEEASTPTATTAATTTNSSASAPTLDEISTAETLSQLLQKRMRDLEAETCRRLIAWEDEKYYSATGIIPKRRDSMEAMSLSTLFQTLDKLDNELDSMEEWLSEKAAVIKPLTDDCREIEEENRQLEQQLQSHENLVTELKRLLTGLDLPEVMQDILSNPSSKMSYVTNGDIDIHQSEEGVIEIYNAGRYLKDIFDKIEEEGGVHLRPVSERVENLLQVLTTFCDSVANIVMSIMEKTLSEVVTEKDFAQEIKDGSHDVIAKEIRETQREFQSSLLTYIKLIEVLALLKPSILPKVREVYTNCVAEGVLSKKRLKAYFQSLPGKSSQSTTNVTIDLKDYVSVSTFSSVGSESADMKPVHMDDVELSLKELLPVIAREAYFTAALFSMSSRHMSGREKKRNFEAAKKSVDHSSQWFKYYVSRVCGIGSDRNNEESGKGKGDPMLSFVSSIILNEAMDGYIDRLKKGGDHSLSLAYVRSTILDLRKKVDKQWVGWIEDQIKWIQSHAGVPLNGKRAGVISSFAKFPSYLDHIIMCCSVGRSRSRVPNLSKFKVITYYLQKMAGTLFGSLHECAERETTDQEYAANVMRMENSYFFTQSIKRRGTGLSSLFQKQIAAASAICKQSTDAYLG